ncbi:c-type cytochrome [Sphingomonas sanguinis]|uniref:Cytochrome C n=1 Tax=Sphingomonas sanguinis TaxID=33051 RepID=A0A147I224_9SPHN|nr:c-type cytochrome [Sphingomonas sanguinis]KTT71633.1 cytochrome C [Sphingomonas sanguinis]
MIRYSVSFALLSCLALGGCGDDGRAERLKAAGPNPSLDALMRVADADAGARTFGQCLACHTIGNGELDRAGPNLHGIMGKPVAGGSVRFGYTAALMKVGGRWDRATMNRWLTSPQRFAPGTKMTFLSLPDPLARADVIAYLEREGRQ